MSLLSNRGRSEAPIRGLRVRLNFRLRREAMKLSALLVASCAFAAVVPIHARAQSVAKKPITFTMVVSAGAAKCLPKATATVVDHTIGPVEDLSVFVSGLPPNTDFDFFIIQVPTAPFGLAWYQGDIQTNKSGKGVGRFVGRFSSETFIVSLGAIPSVNEFPSPPAVLPQYPVGVAVDPVQIYHLRLWFNTPTP